ncbi:MAG: hypothetical protein JRF72_20845, partial [Deltaproteobacteria bacterium]|jgi:hypothetical protein|nr:hypothetical protein [Deltaproteobacteria bacterium]
MATFFLLLTAPLTSAEVYSQLQGYWQCREDGEPATLEFKSRQQLLYNGQAYTYQLTPGVLQVSDGNDEVNYLYTLEGGTLMILSQDGSVTQCQKAKRPKLADNRQKSGQPAPQTRQAPLPHQDWPPPYDRPQGYIDEHDPGAQALLYKFAGRWDHVSANTLTNLYLKPDGTYEEAYEAGYSGQFTDQGGYQTGHWGAAGEQQARGHWRVVGGLRQGQLFLVDQNGRQSIYHYQVHIRGGEVYWGEYFLNDRLYSVKYIYR